MKNMIDYQIIDAVGASIYWKDLSGKYIGCNKYMSKMAGMSRNQIIGNTDYLLPWKNQANKIREIDLWVINNLKEYKTEETAIVYGGIKKIFLSSKSPLLNENGDVIGIIGVSIDIHIISDLKKNLSKLKYT
jgi:PAS domain S-box-containing protein